MPPKCVNLMADRTIKNTECLVCDREGAGQFWCRAWDCSEFKVNVKEVVYERLLRSDQEVSDGDSVAG